MLFERQRALGHGLGLAGMTQAEAVQEEVPGAVVLLVARTHPEVCAGFCYRNKLSPAPIFGACP